MGKFGFNKRSDGTNTHASRAGLGAKLAGGLPFLLLALAAWVVALAGVAVVRKELGESPNIAGLNYSGGESLDFTWWIIFFELFVLLAALIHIIGFAASFVPIGTAAIAGLLAVVAVLTNLETARWNAARKSNGTSTKAGKGIVTAFAGFICLAILNLLLIIVLGNQFEARRNTANHVHGNPVHHEPHTIPETHNATTRTGGLQQV